MPRSTQPTNVIQETTDYSQFKFLRGNRDLNQAHVNAIKTSMDELGNFLASSPILVNKNMEIIDGQHRFMAAKELDLPVFYVVGTDMSLPEARAMNILSKNWGPKDFARSYAASGLDIYKKYLALRDEFPTVGHSTVIIYSQGSELRSIHKNFRQGLYEIPSLAKTKYWLSHLVAISEAAVTFSPNGAPARSLIGVLQSEQYEPDRMLKQVQNNPSFLRAFTDRESQLRQIEALYNKGYREGHNRVRLY